MYNGGSKQREGKAEVMEQSTEKQGIDPKAAEGCNTVTFTATDGAVVSFPRDFLIERGAIIADKINGENIADVMGCSNQLWIPGFPAKYFIRDIAKIDFTCEDEVPPLPDFTDDGHDYTNRPNVSCKAEYVGRVGEPMRAGPTISTSASWRWSSRSTTVPRGRATRRRAPMRCAGYGGCSSGRRRKSACFP